MLKKTEKEEEARREFLKKAAKVAAAVPVATLLVAANSRNALAQTYGRVVIGPTGL